MRVIAICDENCPFRLYAVKMNDEDTWQLRSMNVRHNCKQVKRVGIMHSKWLGKVFKKKVENNPKAWHPKSRCGLDSTRAQAQQHYAQVPAPMPRHPESVFNTPCLGARAKV
ncbi:hypothetical protein PIB30_068053 [Stylosanthes scabra]|uniref:Transposase MuDR plant domain-containing protein n=1 Tax=Stylosanthes scabra TaxID=79078 RepID=A0ABU6RMS0_9FABA|nr:hypothetical protein [Stylosanthes scabra]